MDALSEEERLQLARTAVQVGAVVMAAAPSGGIGVAQEVSALATAVSEAVQGAPPESLLGSLGEPVREVARQVQGSGGLEALVGSVREAGATGLAACRAAAALVDARASAADAAGYKAMLLDVANRVARAATEGGFLGIGGEQVSAAEQEALAAIGAALRGEGGAPDGEDAGPAQS